MKAQSLEHLNYTALLQASKRQDSQDATRKLRLALLADAATQRVEPLLRALFYRHGVDAKIYSAPFGAIELETYNGESELYRFQPDAVAILSSVQALRADFGRREARAIEFANEAAGRMARVWEAIQTRSSATLIQSNFALPAERFFGNFDQVASESFYTAVRSLNGLIVDRAREHRGVLINDIEALASWVGGRNWFDDRFWDIAKSFCRQEHLPLVARNIVDIVMAAQGQVTKCVVLDLDNTLWGGVIGDDGIERIQLSEHGDGEAFYRLQCYLRELHRRGILLAVCSKNDMNNALLPFEKHAEMVLKREHIAVFMANWDDKAQNIRRIRETLNIGFDSMVFLDDNPFERNLVRELVPGIVVPELPEDPADYVRAICELNLFEATSFSDEDVRRNELYRQEFQRKEEAAGFASVGDFLGSLNMQITVARFDPFHIPRIAQLIQRSNQFNLTTRRLSEAECESIMTDPAWIPLYAKLSDRLGDHGLISVVILKPCAGDLTIHTWLMSCRVLTRGVEQYLMNRVFEEAARLGVRRVTGEYIPTPKNSMVKEFFAGFGFHLLDDHGGHSKWALERGEYQDLKTFIHAAPEAESVLA